MYPIRRANARLPSEPGHSLLHQFCVFLGKSKAHPFAALHKFFRTFFDACFLKICQYEEDNAPKNRKEGGSGLGHYFSGRECFRRKFSDASVETVGGDFEEHFHHFLGLLLGHDLLEPSLFRGIEVHDGRWGCDVGDAVSLSRLGNNVFS